MQHHHHLNARQIALAASALAGEDLWPTIVDLAAVSGWRVPAVADAVLEAVAAGVTVAELRTIARNGHPALLRILPEMNAPHDNYRPLRWWQRAMLRLRWWISLGWHQLTAPVPYRKGDHP